MAQHIEKPTKKTFWKVTQGEIVHEGYTEINQVTSTGDEAVIDQHQNPDNIYPTLPDNGELIEGEIYSHNGKMVQVIQSHERTIYEPEQTPALFSIVRQNEEGGEWIAQEQVEVGDTRTYNGVTYQAIQSHQTQDNWSPDVTPALWRILESEIVDWVQPTGGHDAYNIGDRVLFNGSVYESLINANVWSPTVYPAGWTIIQ